MALNSSLPSQFKVIESFDDSIGFARVADLRAQTRMLLLKICDSEHFNDAVKSLCQEWLRQSAKLRLDAFCIPRKMLLTKHAGAFVVFDDLAAVSLERAVCDIGRFTPISLVQALRGAADAIDGLHQRLLVHGDINAKSILTTEQNVCVLADVRLQRELRQRLGLPHSGLPSVQNDRLAFIALLDELLCSGSDTAGSAIRVGPGATQSIRDYLAQVRISSKTSCSDCLAAIESVLQRASPNPAAIRWQMVVEFLDEVPHAAAGGAEFRAELPQIKSEALAATAPQSHAAPQQTQNKSASTPGPAVLPVATVAATAAAKAPGLSNKLIAGVLLFSMLVLAGVVGFKFYPPPPTPAPPDPSIIYTPDQIKEQGEKLTKAEETARDVHQMEQIAPKTWGEAKNESQLARDFYNKAKNVSEFMDHAAIAVELFDKAPRLAKERAEYESLLQSQPRFDRTSFPAQLREQAPAEFDNAFQLLEQSQTAAKNEEFDAAATRLKEAQDAIAALEPVVRLKAARAETDSAAKLQLLSPLLERNNTTDEVVSMATEILAKNRSLWIEEAKRRIDLLSPMEAIVANCELAKAGHFAGNQILASTGLARSIEAVEMLLDTTAEPQAATAVLHLLDTVAEIGSTEQKRQATAQIAAWCESKMTDPLDASIMAGYCYRLGNYGAWERVTTLAMSKITTPNEIADAAAVNFVVANSSASTLPLVQKLIDAAANTPVACSLAAAYASESDIPGAGEFAEKADQALPAPDGVDAHLSFAHEVLTSALIWQGKLSSSSSFQPASRATGMAVAAECRRAAQSGDLARAVNLWDSLLAQSLMKTDATTAIVQAAAGGRWDEEQIVRWSFNRPARLDQCIACLAAAHSPPDVASKASAPPGAPYALKAGDVLTWKGFLADPPANLNRLSFGSTSGNKRGSTPTPKIQGHLRLFVRAVDRETFSGFLEITPSKEIYFCTGTYAAGTLTGKAQVLISHRTKYSMKTLGLYAVAGHQSAIALLVEETKDKKAPQRSNAEEAFVAGIELTSKNINQATKSELAQIEELESRILAFHFANPRNADDEPLIATQWSVPPDIYIHGDKWGKTATAAFAGLGQLPASDYSRFTLKNPASLKKVGPPQLHLVFAKSEKHSDVAKKFTGVPWPFEGPVGCLWFTGSSNNIENFLAIIDPEAFDEEQLTIRLQHLWANSMGFNLGQNAAGINIGRESLSSFPIASSFTNFGSPSGDKLKPLTSIDRKAIFLFLSQLGPRLEPEKVKHTLFDRKIDDLWTFR